MNNVATLTVHGWIYTRHCSPWPTRMLYAGLSKASTDSKTNVRLVNMLIKDRNSRENAGI